MESWKALPILPIFGSWVKRVERLSTTRDCACKDGAQYFRGRSAKRSQTNSLPVSSRVFEKRMGQRTRRCGSERHQSQLSLRDGAVLRQGHRACG